MSYHIIYLPNAKRDIREITIYLSRYYPSTARNFSIKLLDKISLLKDMPYMYQAYEDDPYFRRMVIDDYLLFYSVDENLNRVLIHRVIHSRKDISQQIPQFPANPPNI